MSQTLANTPKLPDLIPLKLIEQIIEAEIAPLKLRAEELIGMCKRFVEAFPTIETAEADAKAAEVAAVVQRFITVKTGRLDVARIALKAPILAADTAIGSLAKGPFARLATNVEAAFQPVKRASIGYKAKIDRETRETAQAEAKRKAEEARLAEQSAERGGLATMQDAADAAQASEAAQKIADRSTSDMTRTHGDGVGTTSLRYKRVATIINPGLVPREYCSPSQSKIDEARGAAHTPFPVIAGVSFEDVPDLTVRR